MESNYSQTDFSLNHPSFRQDFNTKENKDNEDNNMMALKFKCKFAGCDKIFKYKSEIIRHTSTHTNQRPFVCSHQDCGKSFKRSDALDAHLRIHSGDKPFKCPVGSCQMSFPTKSGLRYHVLKHKNDRVYKCDFPKCEQSFLTAPQLKQHKRGAKVHENLMDIQKQMQQEPAEGQFRMRGARTSLDGPSDFEPFLTKHQHIEHSPRNSTVRPSLNQLDAERILQPVQKNQNEKFQHVHQIEDLHGIPKNDAPANMSQYTGADANSKANPAFSGEPAVLLKTINKILDENTNLKKHVEVCQKIIELFQTNGHPVLKQNPPFKP